MRRIEHDWFIYAYHASPQDHLISNYEFAEIGARALRRAKQTSDGNGASGIGRIKWVVQRHVPSRGS